MNAGTPLAQDAVTVYASPDPARIHAYSPGLAVWGDRLIATLDLGGPGAKDLPGPRLPSGEGGYDWQGKVYTSDDHGQTWTHRADFPFMHARPFVAGKSLFVLGQAGDLMIIRSDDGGQTWSAPATLTEGERWHQAPCNTHVANGCIYLVMEQRCGHAISGWNVGENAPVLMRGALDADLTWRDNWCFATRLPFSEVIDNTDTVPALDWFGVPFFHCPYPRGQRVAPGRDCFPIGWLETNVVQFQDEHHLWHDPAGKTFHLWMRAHTGGTGYACILKVRETGDRPGTGPMITEVETTPSGKRMLYAPCPGGQMKFHVLHDEVTQLYWLLSTQATDSMTRPECLSADRFNLPNNERRRLQLHFSKNMIDWCFAGIVAVGPEDKASRHYASMVIQGADLHILSRSGDRRAKSPHDGNLITFHTVRDFRRLVY